MENEDILKKYNLNLEDLKKEQIKLAKNISLKDSTDFDSIKLFGAVDTIIIKNQIIASVIVCDSEFNIIEQQYFLDKLRFPYLYGFRSFREIGVILEAFNKLTEKPDLVFINGHGIVHPRLGLASHFSLFTGIPTIGIADNIFEEDAVDGEDILRDGKKVGKLLISKEGSRPMYVSPGDKISVKTAFEITKKIIKFPHKLPEPLKLAVKYSKNVQKELGLK